MSGHKKGERPGAREAIAKLQAKWVKHGMDPKVAKQRAQAAARDFDNKNPR